MTSLSDEPKKIETTKKAKSVASSRERLIEAFFAILDLKPFSEITVSELAIAAGVHRSSFYANFENTFELLEASKEKAIADLLDSYRGQKRKASELIDKEHLLPFLRYVKSHPNWYRAYKKNSELFSQQDDFQKILVNVSLPQSGKGVIDSDIAYSTRFYLGGIDAVIAAWINGGFAESEEQIASIINRLSPANLK